MRTSTAKKIPRTFGFAGEELSPAARFAQALEKSWLEPRRSGSPTGLDLTLYDGGFARRGSTYAPDREHRPIESRPLRFFADARETTGA
jgi:hypothetical protein